MNGARNVTQEEQEWETKEVVKFPAMNIKTERRISKAAAAAANRFSLKLADHKKEEYGEICH